MKTILLAILIVLMSFSFVACDNQKKNHGENLTEEQELIVEFRESFFNVCLSESDGDSEFCECSYSKITKKYPETALINIILMNNKEKLNKVLADVPILSAECLDY